MSNANHNVCILVADDEAKLLEATAKMLREEGYRVLEASTGLACLKLARTHQPDLILLDVVLPDITGIEVCQQIKSDPHLATTYITLISGRHISSGSKIHGLDVGADDYITRPISRLELVARVNAMARVRRAEARLRHLNAILEAMHRVNRSVSANTDQYALLQTACENLVSSHGFTHAWAVLHDDDSSESWRLTKAGPAALPREFSERLATDQLPRCAQRALEQDNPVIIENTTDDCPDCFLADHHAHTGSLVTRLALDRVLGVLSVTVPPGFIGDPQEIHLCNEVAVDLASALDRIHREKQQVETAEALRESERRYRTIAENFPNGALFLFDRDLRYIFVDGQSVAVAGLSREQVIGKTMFEVFPPEVYEIAAPVGYRIFEGKSDSYEVWYKGRCYDNQAVPVVRDDGRIEEGIVIVTDITERKKNEAELAEHRDHLSELVEKRTRELAKSREELRESERLAAIGTLATGIAHEINNPIGGILLSAQYALSSTDTPESTRTILDEIVREATRCKSIIQNIRLFARSDRSPKTENDLGAVIHHAVDLTRELAEKNNCTVAVRFQRKLPKIPFNATSMEQVFVNLINNAVEAQARNIQIRVKPMRKQIVIELEDDGAGMNDDQMRHLFDPFYTTRQSQGGTGLGLSIVHGIISDHDGKITTGSVPGEGTTFTIRLPLPESNDNDRG